jgi:hypothetical protein
MVTWARTQGCHQLAYPGNLDVDEPEQDMFT